MRSAGWVRSWTTLALMIHWDREWKVVTVHVGPFHRSWEYGEED